MHTNLKRTMKQIDHHFFVNHLPSLTPPHIAAIFYKFLINTLTRHPRPRAQFSKSKPGQEAFRGLRAEAAGRKRGLCLPTPGGTQKIGPWGGGVGLRAKNQKNQVFSFIQHRKKIEQRFRRPHGIGFPTVMSTIFSTRKGSVMTIEGERIFFWW